MRPLVLQRKRRKTPETVERGSGGVLPSRCVAGEGCDRGLWDMTATQVHFNGWKSKFDEWMDWGSFRLAPCGSRSSARREGEQASGPVKKESSTRCVLVPARRTARIRIEDVDDW